MYKLLFNEDGRVIMSISPTISLGDIITAIAAAFSAVAAWAAVKTVNTQTSPDVIAFPETYSESSDSIRLTIRNIGHAPAYDIQVNLSEGVILSGNERMRAQSFCDAGIAMLAPEQSHDFLLGSCAKLREQWENKDDAPFVRLSYFGKVDKKKLESREHFGRGKQYHASFPVNLSPFFGHASIKVTTPEDKRFQNALRAFIQLPNELESLRKAVNNRRDENEE